jgi:hypothetical protein
MLRADRWSKNAPSCSSDRQESSRIEYTCCKIKRTFPVVTPGTWRSTSWAASCWGLMMLIVTCRPRLSSEGAEAVAMDEAATATDSDSSEALTASNDSVPAAMASLGSGSEWSCCG